MSVRIKLIEIRKYSDLFIKRYKLNIVNDKSTAIEVMDEIAEKTSAYKKGGGINYDKVSNLIINDFRKGLIGRISLE